MTDNPQSPAPRSLNLTPQEHEVWMAVYMDTLKHERARTYYAQASARDAAKEAVLHYREMSLPAVEQPPKEAANG